jgi:DnaJ-class molecular chaperone
MSGKDPYEILGVDRRATPEAIKKAYRRLAKAHHPDRNPGDASAEQRFKEVQAAYEVLGDPEKRAQYDRFGAGGPRPDFGGWGGAGRPGRQNMHVNFGGLDDLSSIFEQFFTRGGRSRGGSRARSAARGANIEHDVHLSLEEVARGTERELMFAARGANQPAERITFRIPAGVRDQQQIRLRGQGQDGPGGRGDLMIRCHVQKHPYFRRDGLDLSLDLRLTFSEAARGAQVEIPTLDGTTVVKVPPGTSGGTRLRLRGHGLREARTDRVGDLYAVVRIDVPKTLSPRAGELLAALEAELGQHPRGEVEG